MIPEQSALGEVAKQSVNMRTPLIAVQGAELNRVIMPD